MKTKLQKICAILLTLASLCIISGCATTSSYSLKQTRNDIDFAMNRYRNEVSFGHIAPSFQPEVNNDYQAYKTAFEAAVQQANSNYDAPTPDNVKQLANQLLSILGSIPVVP
jgi:uncharacterized lipoprotein